MDNPYEEATAVNNHGREYYIFKNDIMHHAKIGNKGPYQKQNLVALRTLVPQARQIIDVGSNLGMNIVEYSTFANEVHGFEPIPPLYYLAKKNIEHNKNHTATKTWFEKVDPEANMTCSGEMYVYPCGLGDSNEILTYLDRETHNSGLCAVDWFDQPTRSGRTRKRKREYKRREIETRTLDSFEFSTVDAIKIDTEGFEIKVIKGAEKTIEEQRPVVQVETIKGQPERFGYTCQDILDWFTSRDYDVYLCDGTNVHGEWYWVRNKMDRFFIPREMNVEGFAKDE